MAFVAGTPSFDHTNDRLPTEFDRTIHSCGSQQDPKIVPGTFSDRALGAGC